MKALASLILAFALLLTAAAPASAGVIVSLNNPGSTTLHEIEVTPGSTFSVDVNIETTTILHQLICYARASESDVLEIISLTDLSPWLVSGGASPLNPVSEMMAWGVSPPNHFGPGACSVGTIKVAVAPTAQGTYTLDVRRVYYDWGGDWAGGASGPDFVVHVIPEPGVSLLTLGACIFFCLRHRR
jgi:hypothetical protein